MGSTPVKSLTSSPHKHLPTLFQSEGKLGDSKEVDNMNLALLVDERWKEFRYTD
ncbi:hypothetical protein KOR42_54240 [Thalassoglobus neptunius]|uniref:Uncharacterized protein n=1 Tax=Thalassoglobus neptunius TaxID=1938619 RepID=A0A5C5UW21_9PLAN|nr:hypothetical protein KOR42_54240 [Thalassoglobus neptunius]